MKHAAWRERQHADAPRRQLPSLLVGQADERSFGRVVAHRPTAFTTPDAGDVQDDALLAAARLVDRGRLCDPPLACRRFEQWQRQPRRTDRGPQVPVQRRSPSSVLLLGPSWLAAADERDEDIETAQPRSRIADGALELSGVRRI